MPFLQPATTRPRRTGGLAKLFPFSVQRSHLDLPSITSFAWLIPMHCSRHDQLFPVGFSFKPASHSHVSFHALLPASQALQTVASQEHQWQVSNRDLLSLAPTDEPAASLISGAYVLPTWKSFWQVPFKLQSTGLLLSALLPALHPAWFNLEPLQQPRVHTWSLTITTPMSAASSYHPGWACLVTEREVPQSLKRGGELEKKKKKTNKRGGILRLQLKKKKTAIVWERKEKKQK